MEIEHEYIVRNLCELSPFYVQVLYTKTARQVYIYGVPTGTGEVRNLTSLMGNILKLRRNKNGTLTIKGHGFSTLQYLRGLYKHYTGDEVEFFDL